MADKPDKTLEHRQFVLRSVGMTRDIMTGLEGKVKDLIRDGEIDYAQMLSVKAVLDEATRTIEDIQALDSRIRRLISQGPEDSMERAALAFLEKDRVITD